MGSKERKPKPTLTGRFVRGRRFDRYPLRRPADRAETIVMLNAVPVCYRFESGHAIRLT